MENELYLYIRSMCYGGSITLFIYLAIRLFDGLKRQTSQHAQFIFKVSAVSMIAMAMTNMCRLVSDSIALDNLQWYVEHLQYVTNVSFIHMFVLILMSQSVVAICTLKGMKFAEWTFNVLPVALLLVIYNLTLEMGVFYACVCYTCIVAAVATWRVHINTRRYYRLLVSTYSSPGQRGIKWIYNILYSLTFVFVAWFVLVKLNYSVINSIIYLVLSMIPWGYYVYKIRKQNFNIRVMEDIAEHGDEETIITGEEPAGKPVGDPAATTTRTLSAWLQPAFDDAATAFCNKKETFTNPDLSIDDVAAAVGSNRTYISRWCNSKGVNFSSYITGIRLVYARTLLLDTDMAIVEVLEAAGFRNPRFFREAFSARYGMLPNEYRRANKGRASSGE